MKTTIAGRACVLLIAASMTGQAVSAQELIVTKPAPQAAPAGPVRDGERLRAAPIPAAPAPVAPAAAPAVKPPVISNATAAQLAEKDDPNELPKGAPSDDYEFLGWCTGLLTGHMELYKKVKPELKAISKRWDSEARDAEQEAAQQKAGTEILAQFRHAMGTVEAASPTPISLRGQTAMAKGLAVWDGADKIDAKSQAYSWMNFGLPARCENKAVELEKSGGKVATARPATVAQATAAPVAATATVPAAKPAATPAKPAAKPAPAAAKVGLRR